MLSKEIQEKFIVMIPCKIVQLYTSLNNNSTLSTRCDPNYIGFIQVNNESYTNMEYMYLEYIILQKQD